MANVGSMSGASQQLSEFQFRGLYVDPDSGISPGYLQIFKGNF